MFLSLWLRTDNNDNRATACFVASLSAAKKRQDQSENEGWYFLLLPKLRYRSYTLQVKSQLEMGRAVDVFLLTTKKERGRGWELNNSTEFFDVG